MYEAPAYPMAGDRGSFSNRIRRITNVLYGENVLKLQLEQSCGK